MIRIPYIIVQWLFFAAIRLPLVLFGLVGVFLSLLGDGQYRTPRMWKWCADAEGTRVRVLDTRAQKYWEMAIRNPAGIEMKTPEYVTYGEDDLESKKGFQWRYCHSKYLDGFRCTWGEPRNKGKREFYIGWKLKEEPTVDFTFFQLRLF